MSVLGDRIVEAGPFRDGEVAPPELLALVPGFKEYGMSAVEWNALRQELIDLRARVRQCVVCNTSVDPGEVECVRCAGAEDAAAKRSADQ